MGRSHTNYHHGQNRPDLGKINLIYCQLKEIWMVRNKGKSETAPFPSPLSQADLQPFIPDTSTSRVPLDGVVQGDGVCGQSTTAPLCRSFFLTLFPCPSVGAFPGLQSFRMNRFSTGHGFSSGNICLLWCGVLCGLSMDTCSAMVSSLGSAGQSLL